MRESKIETAYRKVVEAIGGSCLKFVSPGRRGVPDRIVLMPIDDPTHREIVARYFRFVELKQFGEKPKPHQSREHARLRALGYRVDVVDGC